MERTALVVAAGRRALAVDRAVRQRAAPSVASGEPVGGAGYGRSLPETEAARQRPDWERGGGGRATRRERVRRVCVRSEGGRPGCGGREPGRTGPPTQFFRESGLWRLARLFEDPRGRAMTVDPWSNSKHLTAGVVRCSLALYRSTIKWS